MVPLFISPADSQRHSKQRNKSIVECDCLLVFLDGLLLRIPNDACVLIISILNNDRMLCVPCSGVGLDRSLNSTIPWAPVGESTGPHRVGIKPKEVQRIKVPCLTEVACLVPSGTRALVKKHTALVNVLVNALFETIFGKRDSTHHHLLEAISETAKVLELRQKLLYTTPSG